MALPCIKGVTVWQNSSLNLHPQKAYGYICDISCTQTCMLLTYYCNKIYSKLGMSVYMITLHEGLPFMLCFVLRLMLRISHVIAEPKGEASNRDALSFHVGMYVCMYVCISADCVMQFYACVCTSVTLAELLHNSVAKMCHRGRLRPWTTAWPVWPVSYGRTQPQAFVPALLTAHRIRFQ